MNETEKKLIETLKLIANISVATHYTSKHKLDRIYQLAWQAICNAKERSNEA